jgi:hypothetical protein
VCRRSAWFLRWREAMVAAARLILTFSSLFIHAPISGDIAGKESLTGFVVWCLIFGSQGIR